MTPRILLLDIETTPMLVWAWSPRTEYISDGMVKEPSGLLMWAAKWYKEKKVMYATRENGEKQCLKKMYDLMCEADIVVGHNGKAFDVRKLNGMFFRHGWATPDVKVVDTLTTARRYFKLDYNKLDYIGKYRGHGGKIVHTGFELWKGCMANDKKSWDTMIKYNKRDVTLLEEVYTDLLPWMENHPNHGAWTKDQVCKNCGSHKLQRAGYKVLNSGKYQRWQCQDCGCKMREKEALEKFSMLV